MSLSVSMGVRMSTSVSVGVVHYSTTCSLHHVSVQLSVCFPNCSAFGNKLGTVMHDGKVQPHVKKLGCCYWPRHNSSCKLA